jgi:LPS export ABC transporter permease LptF/LPS export ABC transporter permease LptG
MFRILDRYLVREIVMPFFLGLTVLTFILEIPPILNQAEQFISRGVEWSIVIRVLGLLLPQALCLTIPMAVLLGILVGFGRLSADREFVAMQACGVSLMRLARPVLLVAGLGTIATAYETIVALPDANQSYREIVYVVMATRVESNVRPRVFFQDFPDKVIYVRELPPEGGWRDVFVADTARGNETTVYFAKQGRIRLDQKKKLVQLELLHGTSHTTHTDKPDDYEELSFESSIITLDPNQVFKLPPEKGAREMNYAELRQAIGEASKRGDPAYEPRFMIQQKTSLPMACPILALIGLALGATNRKDGKLGSFVIGIAVIFVYYVLLWGARAAAMGGRFSPEWAPWIPNIVMGFGGLVMFAWRARLGDQPLRLRMPSIWRRTAVEPSDEPNVATANQPKRRAWRLPRLRPPLVRVLDVYISREYLRLIVIGIAGLLALFYISTFIDLADKLFRGETTWAMLTRYFYFRTPQFVYYVIPMSVLVSTLVTIGLLTKNSELLVMRACGISLYRAALPLLICGVFASGVLYVMQERVLVSSNREADKLERTIRHWPEITTALNRRWIVGTSGEMYHYDFFDQRLNRFTNLLVYRLDEDKWRLRAVTRANDAVFIPSPAPDPDSRWMGRYGWTREMVPGQGQTPTGEEQAEVKYETFTERELKLEPSSYFKTEEPNADLMTYQQLSDYIARMNASGANVMPWRVDLARKVAFPFVTVIMTVLAVPFAVSTGRKGAMYGIGIGIALAIIYIVALSVFAALGKGGALPPLLAAWAPNMLFGAAAVYMVLTVRT